MQRFFLEAGLVVQREGRFLEYQRRSEHKIYFEDPVTGDIEGFTEEQFWTEFECKTLTIADARSTPTALKLPEPNVQPPLPIALNEKYETDHLRKLDYVGGMGKRGITKGLIDLIEEAIPEIAAEINDPEPPAADTVARWMREIERAHGDTSVLVSGHAVTVTRQRQDADHEALIGNVIGDHLGKLSVTKIWGDHYLTRLKNLNAERAKANLPVFKPISARTLSRRVEKLDRYDVEVARHGRQEARRTFRMIKGHMPADRPLEYVEIDHAKLRLWVIDDQLLLPLGRPWITALKDRYSGMLLGFYVSFRGPSLYSTFRAIRHSLSCHLDLHKHWPDLEHPWVAFGPAGTYVSDRGSDFLSTHYCYAIRQLRSDYSYCESRTPWHKPHIERTFLSIHDDLLESHPGEVFKGLPYSRDYNPKEDAVVRFSTLIYLLIKWAVDYHPYQVIGGRRARPIDLWMDGIGDAPIGYMPNPDALNIILGRRYTATLRNQGVRFKHLRYANNDLEALYRKISRKSVAFIPHEENLGRIHVEDSRDKRWFEVECTRGDYAEGLSIYQHQYILQQAKRAAESVRDVDQLVRYKEQTQLQIAEDIARKDSATKVRLARYCGIDSTAIFAGRPKSLADLQSQANSDLLVPERTASETGKILIPDAPFVDVPIFKWGVV
ncbi:MAG: hypothetical protein ACYC9L_03680 [Sulfuricaulis sp.]